MKLGDIKLFIRGIEERVYKDRWSFDAAIGYAKHKCLFVRNKMISA